MMFLGFVYFRTGIFLWGTNPIMALSETIWIGVVRRASARVYRPHSSRRQDEEMIKSHGTVCVCEIFVPLLIIPNTLTPEYLSRSLHTTGSLSKDVFEQRTSTGSEDFSLVICLDAM